MVVLKMRNVEIIYLIIGLCLGGLIGFSLALSYSNFFDNNIDKIIINDNEEKIICNDSLLKNQLESKEYTIDQYKLIVNNLHNNYNKQDERFERMLNWSLESREELYSCYTRLNELDFILRSRYNWDGVMY